MKIFQFLETILGSKCSRIYYSCLTLFEFFIFLFLKNFELSNLFRNIKIMKINLKEKKKEENEKCFNNRSGGFYCFKLSMLSGREISGGVLSGN